MKNETISLLNYFANLADTVTITLNYGKKVNCDICNKDYSYSDEHGGFLFGSKGVCPDCAPEFLQSVIKHNEESHIRAYCPKDMSFKDWMLSFR